MDESTEICTRCGQPKPTRKPGTITQWISVCQCALVDAQFENIASICTNCGHAIDTGRRGSFTQWIFRSQVCECESPSPSTPGSIATEKESSKEELQPDDNEYLDVPPESFPIERYRPLDTLGAGGAGAVYLCWDNHLNKKVAVKVLLDSDKEATIKFQQEAKVTAKFSHPNVIGIIDFGMTESGVPFMVLDHFKGVGLDTILTQHGPADIWTTVDIAIKVADALAYAHEENIFHRDIKPSNVLIAADSSGDCTVKVIDFGVAFMAASQHSTNFQGKTLVGTPKYMPPDLALGKTYDVKSEIYSFGCLLYELIAGRPPFEGEDALDLISKHANEPVPSFEELGMPATLESLQRLVMQCLEKNPEHRFRNMIDLKSELTMIKTTLEEGLPREETQEVIWEEDSASDAIPEEKNSNKIALFVGGLALLFIVTITATLLVNSNEPKNLVKKVGKKRVKPFSSLPKTRDEEMFKYDKLTNLNVARAINTQFFEDKHLKQLEGREDITGVNLFDTGVKGDGLKYIIDLPLKYLDLRQTPVDDAGMKYVGMMHQLKGLTLHKCTYITDAGIKEITKLPLERLDLDQTRITDKGMQYVSEIKTLKVINLRDTDLITYKGIPLLSKLPNLRLIYITADHRDRKYFEAVGNVGLPKISIVGENVIPSQYLRHLDSVDFLSLIGTMHNASHFKELKSLKKLKTLALSKCLLSDEEIDELCKLPIVNLEIVECPSLTAAKLQKIGRMKHLKNLFISQCARVKGREINQFIKEFPQISTSIKMSEVFVIEAGDLISY